MFDEISTNDENIYKIYIGKLNAAYVLFDKDYFRIIFENKEEMLRGANIVAQGPEEEVYFPMFIIELKEILEKTKTCVVSYNEMLNLETLLTSYIVRRITKNEEVENLKKVLIKTGTQFLNDKDLNNGFSFYVNEYKNEKIDLEHFEKLIYELIEQKLRNTVL